MKTSYDSDNYKKQEIKDLYHILYTNRVNEGMSPQQAKRCAMDIASLRFGISNDRVRHILYDKEAAPTYYKTFVFQNNLLIIKSLQELIDTYTGMHRAYENIIREMDEDDNEGRSLIQAKALHFECRIKKYSKLINAIREVNDFYSGEHR